MALERPNVADVDPDGLQDRDAPTPEYLFRRILERLRVEDRMPQLADLRPLLVHLHALRSADRRADS